MQDICTFISRRSWNGNIDFVHFVYEMKIKKLKQPFFNTNYYLYLVVNGKSKLKLDDKEYDLKTGTLFLVPPWQMHEILPEDDFTYLYISFNGSDIKDFFENMGVEQTFVRGGFAHLIDFWMHSIRRISSGNDILITSAVFMYTMSYLCAGATDTAERDYKNIEEIKQYIADNCHRTDLCLKMVADIFFYNEKYFSQFFKAHVGMKFTEYLGNVRINHALCLIKEGEHSVSALAEKSGFGDSYYFSKVFKKQLGVSPASYIKASGRKDAR